MATKVVLRERVRNYGAPGDVVSMSLGYAKYLVGTKQAYFAIRENIEYVQNNLDEIMRGVEERANKYKILANKINDLGKVIIERRVNDNGKLHGSVSESDIVKILSDNDIKVSKSNVRALSIKEVGEYRIDLYFKGGVDASFDLIVEKFLTEEDRTALLLEETSDEESGEEETA